MPGYCTPAQKSSEHSNELRMRGNTYFSKSRGTCSSEKHSLLKLALGLYQKALDAAAEADDYASAHKNIAATLSHLAQYVDGSGVASSSHAQCVLGEAVELLQQAVQHRCNAYLCGEEAAKSEEWLNEEWDSLSCAVDQLVELLSSLVGSQPNQIAVALHQLDVMRTVVPQQMSEVVLVGTSKFLDRIRDTAAALMAPTGRGRLSSEPDWRICLQLLAESKRVLIESIELAIDCEDDESVQDLLHLEEELWIMGCRCESTQARLQGDQMLDRVLAAAAAGQDNTTADNKTNNTMHLRSSRDDATHPSASKQAECLDGVLAAIDLYKSAALLAREKDLQAEAQAFSRLGHTYKVCGDLLNPTLNRDPLVSRSAEERSRAAFLQVLGLVDSLPHRISLMMETWYREARDAISEYQRTTAAEETARREKERAPIREELKEELTALYAAADKGWVELLKHVYTLHPPLNPANRLTDFSGFTVETGKEVLRKAILAYHPDKQGGQPGTTIKWQVLAEEITKALTRKYEAFK